jgi:fatty acid desaturase
MGLEILRDPRVRAVEWRDLVTVSRWEVVKELCLPLPWLVASLSLAGLARIWPALFLPALGCSFIFFLTGLRVVHNAHHYALGLSRRATEWVMFAMSVLMLGSMHAVQRNHLHHHKHCMDDEDLEGYSARLSAWRALLYGPVFPVRLHARALRLGRARHRAWILTELGANAIWIWLVFAILGVFAFEYHVLVMAFGQCMTSFFAVWTVHHDCDRSYQIARTLRGKIRNRVSFEMFFHLEHHLFPQVPTRHLPALAERLDRAAPELQARQVF